MSRQIRPLKLKHLAIAASAGAGKTYQLVTRYIGLLAGGASPESIAALTFSRKAGGEIFAAIVNRLAEAALENEKLEQLNRDLRENGYQAEASGQDRSRVLELLKQVVREMHRARIGTLDSFFVAVLRAFSFEFGLGGDFDIMSEFDAVRSREEVLRQLLQSGGAPGEQGKLSELLLEQHQQLSKGRDEVPVHLKLDEFAREMQHLYQLAPEGQLWGKADQIWPGGIPWQRPEAEQLQQAVAELREQLPGLELKEKSNGYWREFLEEAPRFRNGMKLTWRQIYFLERLIPKMELIRKGEVELKTDRESYLLEEDFCRPLLVLLNHQVNIVLEQELRKTGSLHTLLKTFETTYDHLVRRRGRLSFSDVLQLLSGSHNQEQQLQRLDLDYRLDTSFNHWLLDEFQDTSLPQWRVIANLIDEVLQDDEGDRSLFYVGDVKQAIYNWRGGRAGLFHDLLQYYNQDAEEPRLVEQHLSRSWRSAPPVIHAVNEVFGNLSRVSGLPSGAVERWQKNWEKHTTARTEWSGAVQLHVLSGGNEAVRKQGVFQRTVELLQQLTPWKRGLSCALLVRKNDTGRQLVELLRSQQIPVVWEGVLPVAEGILAQGLLAVVKIAAHPGDTAAWEYLLMTPMAQITAIEFDNQRSRLGMSTLRMIDREGYAGLVSWWRGRLTGLELMSEREQEQALALLEAALEFDQLGSGAPLDFIDFVEEYRKREPLPGSVVQVTTLHQAKGLQYDIVLLPELYSRSVTGRELLSGSREDNPQEVAWLLTPPQKMFREGDPVLRRQLLQQREDQWYERLCLLYVGMTRAIHGLYLITPEQGGKSKATYLSTVVQSTLAGTQDMSAADEPAWKHGDQEWYLQRKKPAAEEPEQQFHPVQLTAGGRRQQLERATPSGRIKTELSAAQLFDPDLEQATQIGTAVHLLLEKVSWLDECDTDTLLAEWQRGSHLSSEVQQEVITQYRTVLASEAARELFTRPHPRVELWREYRFEITIGEEWISGSFDRVQITRDTAGNPVDAVILDFKSSNITGTDYREKMLHSYTPQLELYHRVLRELTGLPDEAIRTVVLLTRNGEILEYRIQNTEDRIGKRGPQPPG